MGRIAVKDFLSQHWEGKLPFPDENSVAIRPTEKP